LAFEQKYSFLKKQNIFNRKETEFISKFQNERNNLFHGENMTEMFLKGFSEEAETNWETLHKIATDAFNSAYHAFDRENKRDIIPEES
jgi:hypothetical protein